MQAYWREQLSDLAPGAVVAVAGRGMNQAYTITPGWRSNPGGQPIAIKIPLDDATIPFRGYIVEARMETTGAETPAAVARDRLGAGGGQGVYVSFVDETVGNFAARSLVAHSSPYGQGQSFTDPVNGITVQVTFSTANGYTVLVDSANPNPSTQSDLQIAPWRPVVGATNTVFARIANRGFADAEEASASYPWRRTSAASTS